MYIYEPGKESRKLDAEMKSALVIIELDTELRDLVLTNNFIQHFW